MNNDKTTDSYLIDNLEKGLYVFVHNRADGLGYFDITNSLGEIISRPDCLSDILDPHRHYLPFNLIDNGFIRIMIPKNSMANLTLYKIN